jgi:hypothetical protein
MSSARKEISNFDEEAQEQEAAAVANKILEIVQNSSLSVGYAQIAVNSALIHLILCENDTKKMRQGAVDTMIHIMRRAIEDGRKR